MDVTLENSNIKDQIRNLQQTYTASMDKLREKQRQLDAAQVENKLLKMKVSTGAWISCSPFPPLASSSSLSFHHQLSHSDFSILFSVGFWCPSVANHAGSDLTALRGFLCSELSVQIGGTPIHTPLGSPASIPVASAAKTSSWHCPYVLREPLGCLQVWGLRSFSVGDFSSGPVVKNLPAKCMGHGFDPWSGKIPHATRQLSLCTVTTESSL